MVRRRFWHEQSALILSAGWPSICDCFNRLEHSSNYSRSAGVLQTNVAKNTSSIAVSSIESQMLYVSWQSCLLCYGNHYIPCFPIVPPCISKRWSLNAEIIFLIYLSIHIFTVKQPNQIKWFDKWWNQSSMLPSIKILLYDAFAHAFGLWCSFLWLLSKMTHYLLVKPIE